MQLQVYEIILITSRHDGGGGARRNASGAHNRTCGHENAAICPESNC